MASNLIHSINPATGELLASYEPYSQAEIDSRLRAAQTAVFSWKLEPIPQRAGLMKKAAGLLRQNKPKYAGIMTSEMGKPIVESEAEVEKCALNCDYYADNAERFLAAVEKRPICSRETSRSCSRRELVDKVEVCKICRFLCRPEVKSPQKA